MIELGVFARVFPPGPAPQVAGRIRAAGFSAAQLNLSAVERPTLDRTLTDQDASAIGTAFHEAGVRIWGLSGTFNAIHPDLATREAGVRGCRAIIARAPAMDVEVVTLCTGTRDPHGKWRAHPDNGMPSAWRDLRATLDALMPAAREVGVRLGIEPEPGNVIRDTDAARRLFAEVGGDARYLAVVLDPANLLRPSTLRHQERILTEAFDSLGEWTAAIHAKDVGGDGYVAPGMGRMDYGLIMRLHASLPHPTPVIAQDVRPDDASRVAAFLRRQADDPRS